MAEHGRPAVWGRAPGTWLLVGIGALAITASCGWGADGEPDRWGAEADRYIAELARVYTANDFYGVLDFYTPTARVEKWRGPIRGGARVRDLIRWNSGDLDQEVLALHLATDGALSLVRWTTTDQFSAVEMAIDRGRITGETVFDLGATQRRSLRSSPDVIDAYESLYAAYAAAWSGESTTSLDEVYAPDATVADALLGIDVAGLEAIAGSAVPGSDIEVASAAGVGDQRAPSPAIHLGPADYGVDPGRAVAVFRVTLGTGCSHQVAMSWTVAGGRIVAERRYHAVASFPACVGEEAAGWWTGLELPGPSDEVVSGVLVTPGGQELAIHNGTPLLEGLVLGGFERFTAAGLAEPRVDSVTFEPSRRCADRTGRLLQDADSRDLFLCLYESDLCPGGDGCALPAVSRRAAALHELGHAWMLDFLTDDDRARLLDFAGKASWSGDDVPWFDRGVEYAAETLAWGLLEESIPMVRIGSPACETLHRAFVLLTDRPPLRSAADCPAA